MSGINLSDAHTSPPSHREPLGTFLLFFLDFNPIARLNTSGITSGRRATPGGRRSWSAEENRWINFFRFRPFLIPDGVDVVRRGFFNRFFTVRFELRPACLLGIECLATGMRASNGERS